MQKNSTAYKLLLALADGKFHSGQDLGEELGLSRSGIWKSVKQLRQLGIEIQAVTGKGYRIPDGLELLDSNLILQQVEAKQRNALDELQLHTSVTSTNDLLQKVAQRQPYKVIACLAEYQSAGRGRQGKQWMTGFASGLCVSLLWHFSKDPTEIVGLSLAVAVAVVHALKRYGVGDGLELKWPNDILWHGKKLAGILIDLMAEPFGHCHVVIGLGLNVRPPFQSDNINWIDLYSITKTLPQRNQLTGLILDELLKMLPKFATSGLAPFLKEWRTYNSMQDKPVKIITAKQQIHGILRGISNRGELVLETADHGLQHFLSGEVSLRLDKT